MKRKITEREADLAIEAQRQGFYETEEERTAVAMLACAWTANERVSEARIAEAEPALRRAEQVLAAKTATAKDQERLAELQLKVSKPSAPPKRGK